MPYPLGHGGYTSDERQRLFSRVGKMRIQFLIDTHSILRIVYKLLCIAGLIVFHTFCFRIGIRDFWRLSAFLDA